MLSGNYGTYSLLLLSFFINSMQAISELDKLDERDKLTRSSERKLSRKRRYLIFPLGSSIQLVYDSTITIPDYTLYVTTGVTVAMAWGLPAQPTYPDYDLMEPLLDRNDKNTTESNQIGEIESTTAVRNDINKTPYSKQNYNAADAMNLLAHYYQYFQRRKPDSYYFGSSPPKSADYSKQSHCIGGICAYNQNAYYSANNKDSRYKSGQQSAHNIRPPYSALYDYGNQYDAFVKYMNDTVFKPWIEREFTQSTTVPSTTKKPKKEKLKDTDFKPVINKLHTVYVAMGKRSVRHAPLSYEEKFYLDHHRNTRHNLYEIIEKYLFAKGYNGTECVLKTLCEVGQKHHESEPGSFLAEIVRVVFSLPVAQLQRVVHKRHIEYDEAHQATDDCDAKFPLCPNSIWNAGFLIDSDATLNDPNNFQIKTK